MEEFLYESYRNRTEDRRPGKGGHPERNTADFTNQGRNSSGDFYRQRRRDYFKKIFSNWRTEYICKGICGGSCTDNRLSCLYPDHDQVVAAAGHGSREIAGKEISKELEESIAAREARCFRPGEKGSIPVISNQKEMEGAEILQPIICAGDAIGAVILIGKNEKDVFGDTERMLVQTAAGFLGRQMEQ